MKTLEVLAENQIEFDRGPWAIAPPDLIPAMLIKAGPFRESLFETSSDYAVVRIHGVMSRDGGYGGASTDRIREQLEQLAGDETIATVVLDISSPGGKSYGTMELAETVRQLAETKHVIAAITDIGASAAYWVASQANEIVASEASQVGSIGTFMAVVDASQAADDAGYRVHVIRAGEFKGMATLGTAIEEKHLEELQKLVNAHNELFLSAIVEGRESLNRGRVEELADGRMYLAAQAKDLGLIDAVGSLTNVLKSLGESNNMTTATEQPQAEQPQAETFGEQIKKFKDACPGANADFLMECIEGGMTTTQAQIKYIEFLNAQLAEQELAISERESQTQESESVGVDPQQEDMNGEAGTDPKELWASYIAEEIKAGHSRPEAARIVNKKYPGLRQSLLN